ncbi:DUF554 domain-containing protein [Clostridium formicaceticum]|uniref:Membrane protein YdfK n=1 Tax=Clostridium formicaceticum TaxID=1497 RepID=A0AAC9WFQ6_9CLOT|nr:DUF554 domain-containing protein [Clostridium formicaceticum]AOY75747.1 hypothetical protein BJL90_07450 [Clostridium formicaceticum]ARE86070.1 putative membrane protein YdfK [Clostridium formicaceticum]
MLGTIVNTIAIACGGLLGVLLRKGIPEHYKTTIMQGIGLSVLVIGLMGAFKSGNILVVIFSIVVGSIIGEKIKIATKLDEMGLWIEGKMGKGHGSVAKGFVTASLVYCVGAMAIVGSLESGLTGNHQTLYAKSLLDGISSVIFASTLGIGVVFSAAAVFIYQGIITITAGAVKYLLVEAVIQEMSAIGGLLIVGIAFNILEIKRISVANMLPAIFLPIVYQLLQPLLLSITTILQNIF